MKIYAVKGGEGLRTTDFEYFLTQRPNADLFVYNYQWLAADFIGEGIAIWRECPKWGYAYLGHCSCYGPLEKIDSVILYTLPELKKLAKIGGYEWQYSAPVIAYIERLLELEEKEAEECSRLT